MAIVSFVAAVAAVASLSTCKDGYLVSGAGNASVNGCYKPTGELFGAPRYVKDDYSELFRYCGSHCPMSSMPWRIGLVVADSPSCETSNQSCWTLTRAFYTMPCITEWPSHDGWTAWGYNHHDSKPILTGAKLSPNCSKPSPPGPSPPGPSPPGQRCGYTAHANIAGMMPAEFSSSLAVKAGSVPWTTQCECVDVPGTTVCQEVDMAQESTPKHCTPDLRSVPADLQRPTMRTDITQPMAGMRVKQTHPDFAHTAAYHALYLPPQWKNGSGVKLPVLVEYSGNGPWASSPGEWSVCERE